MKRWAHLVYIHELFSSIFLSLPKGSKLDVLRRPSFVTERRLDSVKIVGANSHQLTPSANVLMQLILEIHERVVGALGELDVAKHCSCEVGSNFCCLKKIRRVDSSKGFIPLDQ